MKLKTRYGTAQRVSDIFILSIALVTVFPFYWMLVTSFKPAPEIFLPGVRLLPIQPVIENYKEVFLNSLILRYLWNGAVVVSLTLLFQLLLTIPAAFAFARIRFPLRDKLFVLIIAALVFPRFIAAIPNFLMLSALKLNNTYFSLIVPFVGSAYGVFLFRQFFKSIPQSYFDAAFIDGCTIPQILYHVAIPFALPVIGSYSIISVLTHWNDLFWPLVIIHTNKKLTPPAGVVHFASGEGANNYGAIMAAAVIIILPLIVMYVAGRKKFFENALDLQLK